MMSLSQKNDFIPSEIAILIDIPNRIYNNCQDILSPKIYLTLPFFDYADISGLLCSTYNCIPTVLFCSGNRLNRSMKHVPILQLVSGIINTIPWSFITFFLGLKGFFTEGILKLTYNMQKATVAES